MRGLIDGLDVHKDGRYATIVDWFGNILESRRIARTRSTRSSIADGSPWLRLSLQAIYIQFTAD